MRFTLFLFLIALLGALVLAQEDVDFDIGLDEDAVSEDHTQLQARQ